MFTVLFTVNLCFSHIRNSVCHLSLNLSTQFNVSDFVNYNINYLGTLMSIQGVSVWFWARVHKNDEEEYFETLCGGLILVYFVSW